MASSRDLITIFIGLELVSGPAFLLAGWRKGDLRSNEASLKFFLTGVLSSAILLFGMSLVYGTTGETTFTGIAASSAALAREPAFVLGVLFVLVGFGFKVAAVPFHFWAPTPTRGPLPRWRLPVGRLQGGRVRRSPHHVLHRLRRVRRSGARPCGCWRP